MSETERKEELVVNENNLSNKDNIIKDDVRDDYSYGWWSSYQSPSTGNKK